MGYDSKRRYWASDAYVSQIYRWVQDYRELARKDGWVSVQVIPGNPHMLTWYKPAPPKTEYSILKLRQFHKAFSEWKNHFDSPGAMFVDIEQSWSRYSRNWESLKPSFSLLLLA